MSQSLMDSIVLAAPRSNQQGHLFNLCVQAVSAAWKDPLNDPDNSPDATTRALWLAAAGRHCSFQQAMLEALPELSPAEIERLKALVDSFVKGERLAFLTGRWRFMGLDFLTGPQALIPRKETELLCSKATALLHSLVEERGNAIVVEPCTGSGNLAVTLARAEPDCFIWAMDLSDEALELARQNAIHFAVDQKIRFRPGDLFRPLEQAQPALRADLIVCNPPYISSGKLDLPDSEVLKYGPRMAFDGGPFGLSIVSRLIHESAQFLKPGSYLCFEAGAGQGPLLAKLIGKLPQFASVQLDTEPRTGTPVLTARTSSPEPAF
ncbi:MAG TPA: HemK/PrmC family methyltransferase [Candidatus Dormibacteraeota bacterium]|nr:HemK/PrmC family methyltransferase [Candidatus Dormibacteraeota bacterium]